MRMFRVSRVRIGVSISSRIHILPVVTSAHLHFTYGHISFTFTFTFSHWLQTNKAWWLFICFAVKNLLYPMCNSNLPSIHLFSAWMCSLRLLTSLHRAFSVAAPRAWNSCIQIRNCCAQQTHFIVTWKCTYIWIQTQGNGLICFVMCPRSSNRGCSINASITVTVVG